MKFKAEGVLNVIKLSSMDRATAKEKIEKRFPGGINIRPTTIAAILQDVEDALERPQLSKREIDMLINALENLYAAGMLHGIRLCSPDPDTIRKQDK